MKIYAVKKDKDIYVENGSYEQGVHCVNNDLAFPDISVEYTFLQWSDLDYLKSYYIDINGDIKEFSVEQSDYLQSLVSGWINPTSVTDIKIGIQVHIDTKASELGYDNINSIAKYMGYDNPYRVEAETLAFWVASCWSYIEAELINVEAGTRTLPTLDEAIAELPAYGV